MLAHGGRFSTWAPSRYGVKSIETISRLSYVLDHSSRLAGADGHGEEREIEQIGAGDPLSGAV
eukprot:5643872-Pyramimonas_sp.AAC.1